MIIDLIVLIYVKATKVILIRSGDRNLIDVMKVQVMNFYLIFIPLQMNYYVSQLKLKVIKQVTQVEVDENLEFKKLINLSFVVTIVMQRHLILFINQVSKFVLPTIHESHGYLHVKVAKLLIFFLLQ